jgi:hypothetical protein
VEENKQKTCKSTNPSKSDTALDGFSSMMIVTRKERVNEKGREREKMGEESKVKCQ